MTSVRAILTYHSIDPSGSVISVDETTFRRQAEWLAASSTRAVTVDELLATPDDDQIAITFDDAYENFADTAWPILRDLDLPATVFAVTRRAGGDNAWEGVADPQIPTLPLLDWDALGRLAEEGVQIGSHTRTHPHLDRLDPDRLIDEIEGAASDIERQLGSRPTGFAYPYGDVHGASETAVAKTHAWACTTELGVLDERSKPHRLPRLDAYYYRRSGQLEAWGTTTFRARLSVRRVARDARRWAGRRGA